MKVWTLSIAIEADKTSLNKTSNNIKQKFKEVGWDIEKAVWTQVFATLKKEANKTIKTIWWLNEKLAILKWRLEVSKIWSREFKKLQKEIKQTELQINKATWQVWWLKTALLSLWPVIWIAFAVQKLIEFWKSIFDLTSKNQQLENSFVTLTWSAEKARLVLQQIDDLAEDSPFEKFALAESTKKLIWFWIAAENAIPIMHVLGNAVAAMWWSEEMLDWIVLALWQIQAKWKLSAEELMQMAERGIPVFQILQEQLWLTEKEIWNIWAAWIDANEAIPALLAWMQEKYLWALEEQSNTLQWQLWKIKDEVVNQMSDAWKKMEWDFKSILRSILDAVKTNFSTILNIFRTIFNSILTIWKTVFWALNSVFNTFTWTVESWSWKQLSALNKVLIWVQMLANWIAFLWDIFSWVVKVWLSAFGELWENAKIFGWNLVKLFWNVGHNAWAWLWNMRASMKDWIKFAAKKVEDFVNGAIDLLNYIPWVEIKKATFSNSINWWDSHRVNYKSLTSWFDSLTWFSKTKAILWEAFYNTLNNNTNRFNEMFKSIDTMLWEWEQKEKKYNMKELDWIGQAIVDKREELKNLVEWSEEYKAKQEEILSLEEQMKDMLYKATKEQNNKNKSQDKATKWAKWATKTNEELKKSIKELEEETNNLKKSYDEVEKWLESLEKQKESFAKESEKYEKILQDWIDETNIKLREQQEEYQKSIDLLKEQRAEKLANSDLKFEEKIWKRAAELDKEVKKVEQKLNDLRLQNLNNTIENSKYLSRESLVFLWKWDVYGTKASDLLKVKEYAEELEKLKKEQQEIADLMKKEWIDAINIESEKKVAESSKTYQMIVEWEKEIDKINKEFDKKEAEKLKKLEQEEEKINKIKNIYEKFWEIEKLTAKDLENLKNNKKFKELSKEEQDIIVKLAEEKIKLTEQSNFIMDLENKVAEKKVELSQKTTDLLSKDLSRLWDNYKKIINQIQQAISTQRTLNSMTWKRNWLGSYAEWWYTWDGGKYEEAWIVHKWEYVIPQHMLKFMPNLMPSLEAIRTGQVSTTTQNFNTKKSIDVGSITVNSPLDLELFFEKQKWKL